MSAVDEIASENAHHKYMRKALELVSLLGLRI